MCSAVPAGGVDQTLHISVRVLANWVMRVWHVVHTWPVHDQLEMALCSDSIPVTGGNALWMVGVE